MGLFTVSDCGGMMLAEGEELVGVIVFKEGRQLEKNIERATTISKRGNL